MTFLQKHHGQMSDSMLTAFFIILSGGLQDAYTYCCRGKVFANAQTGNIVLLGMRLAVMHNLSFYNHLMERIRQELDAGTFGQFHDHYVQLLDTRI